MNTLDSTYVLHQIANLLLETVRDILRWADDWLLLLQLVAALRRAANCKWTVGGSAEQVAGDPCSNSIAVYNEHYSQRFQSVDPLVR
jgi:hypothetical protein